MQKKLVTKKTTALKKKRKVSAHSKTKLKNLKVKISILVLKSSYLKTVFQSFKVGFD